ncbi:IS3 family transposase [Micromonospora eburnea]|uniref:Transposase InsO and inactivated derivatives n=1 Tax=Micromonospora eburnea TaxID=227316 RepID=A0A1C6TSB5_9ACTN|nr:IS3 family transposase [Micromonospora eburnea]SCL44706.1 Transposase InsO and inactivated derivatives [Micromonospora eburnea]
MPRRYPPEFRRKVLDLLKAGRSVAELVRDLEISDQTIYNWRRQELIDTGQMPGVTSADQAELVAARRRIAELETELAVHRRAAELLKEVVPPKDRYAAIQQMAAEGLPVEVCCRVLEVSASGYYAWRNRPPSPRALRHAWLTEQIRAVHLASRGTYGSRRVHAELRLGRGLVVGYHAVEMLMRRAAIRGLPGSRRPRPKHQTPTASDLVNRDFTRSSPNQLWVTDITEHPTREGKVYCAVVLDTFSRKVVGWSIDATQTATLVTNALSMAISNRQPTGTVIHSDHGVQFTSWAFTRRVQEAGLAPSMGSIGDCYDNGMIESFWGRMQTELLNRRRWRTRIELANAIFEYLEIFHNRQRRHSSLGMLTPIEYERLHPIALSVA